MSTNEDGVIRLEAKLGSMARTGRTAMVCFYVRGQEDDLAKLSQAGQNDLLLGVVVEREVTTADGVSE